MRICLSKKFQEKLTLPHIRLFQHGVMGRLLFVETDSVGSLIRGEEQPWSILLDWTYRWTRRISALSTVTVAWCWKQKRRLPPQQSPQGWRRHRSVSGSCSRRGAWHR